MSGNPPVEVARLLERRAAARAARDWATADALRDEIRALGWDPIDGPDGTSARPVLPEEPAPRLDEPATLDVSLVVIVEDHPADLARLADALREHGPAGSWELVVVANAVPAEAAFDPDAVLHDLPAGVLPAAGRLGWADAANLGLRRAAGSTVVLLDGSVEPTGDVVAPLRAALAEPGVGLAGPFGVTSADGRQFVEAGPGEVDAIEGYCLAARREALQAVGGFDRRFRFYRNADLDLSFAVRDAGWRAMAVDGIPLRRHAHRGWEALPEAERDRLSRRNFYRFLDHWGHRPDLLLASRAALAG